MSDVALEQESYNPEVGRFAASILRVLRPLIRLMVGNITFPAFLNMAKTIYVEEAKRKLLQRDPNARITKSSLALLTGIDTRAISQVMNQSNKDKELEAQDLLPEASVLGAWTLKPDFLDATGAPKDLPIYGRGATFQSLVSHSAGRNVTAQTVVDRLVATGNIEIIDENTVKMLSRHYFPLSGAKYEMVDVGMQAAANLLGTVQHNVEFRDDPDGRFLQQQRWSSTIPVSKYADFQEQIKKMMHSYIDASLEQIELFEEDTETSEQVSAGVGFYYFESPKDSK